MMKLRKQSGSVFILAMVLVGAWLPVNVSAQTAAFVAVANDGTNAAYSYDGINWFLSPSGLPSSDHWQALAYGGGEFVALSSADESAAYSSDGFNWSPSPTGMPAVLGGWSGVTYANSFFTAVCYQDGLLAYSTDGESWTNVLGPVMTSPVYLLDYCWGIASCVIGGPLPYGTTTIVVTALGNNAYAFNRSPPDGLWQSWNLPSVSGWVVAYGNQEFVAVGPDTNAYSTNAIDWNSAPCVSGDWSSIAYGGGTFVALQGGPFASGPSATAQYTTNPAVGWSSCTMPVSDYWSGIAYNNGLFVAVGSSSTNAAYSADGINWYPSSLPVSDSWVTVTAGPVPSLPVITNEPVDIATLPAFSPTFSVGATSTYALGYQWLLDGTNIAGATNSSYTLVNVQSNDVGSYAVVVTNIYGSVTSSVATLTLRGYITNGLVAWWRMADQSGSNALDWSGNGLNLPLYGSPTWGSNYITFNGTNQYGNISGTNALLNTLEVTNLTICAWVYKTSVSQKGIVNKYSSAGGGWLLQFSADNQLDWFVDPSTTNLSDTGPLTIPLNEWTFVAATWANPDSDSNQVTYYINGVQNSQSGTSGSYEAWSGGADMQVGNIFTGTSYAFDGSMHDVAVYNRVLSPLEILTNFADTEWTTNVLFPDLLYYEMLNAGATNPLPLPMTNSVNGTVGAVVLTRDGTLVAPEWHAGLGGVSNGLHFNGQYSYLDTSNAVDFNFTTNLFTINFWIHPDSAEPRYIMQNGYEATNGWYVELDDSDEIYFGTETNGVDQGVLTGPGAAKNDTWSMVTIVRTEITNALIYINGEVATNGYIISPAPSTNNLIFGVDATFNTNLYLDGDIWLPQFWSTPLNPAGIANLYFNQRTGNRWP